MAGMDCVVENVAVSAAAKLARVYNRVIRAEDRSPSFQRLLKPSGCFFNYGFNVAQCTIELLRSLTKVSEKFALPNIAEDDIFSG